jgi:hypothetical protein
MASIYDAIRIETLVALSLCASDFKWPGQQVEEDASRDDVSPVYLLAALGSSDQHAIELQFSRFAKLDAAGQQLWLSRALKRVRAGAREREQRFDPNVHPGHIVAALRQEPKRIQRLALSYTPKHLAWVSARMLGLEDFELSVQEFALHEGGPLARIASVVKQSFLWQFVTADMLREPTHLDLLSGVELARLVRLLGVRQTAIACRGLTEVERVSTFLRRFSPEDAQSIAAHMARYQRLARSQIEFAESLLQQRLKEGLEAAAMLDRVGLCLLAVTMAARGPVRQRYTAQKLSPPASAEMFALVHGWRDFCAEEMAEQVIKETESLAAQLRRAPAYTNIERRQTAAYTLEPLPRETPNT